MITGCKDLQNLASCLLTVSWSCAGVTGADCKLGLRYC